jgi:2-methylisocitrate lyase-like PEP mutase family enzyme
MRNSTRLRNLIEQGELLMAPGAFDAITAFLVQQQGFPAVYLTGSGISLSLLAHPDLNTVSYLELKQKVEDIRSVVDIPMIVDIDIGYGGPLNLIRLVRDFEQLDVAAVQIEDQVMPKRCGHELGRQVAPAEVMCNRIKTIVENRNKENGILIVARTDARTTEGIKAAIERANSYVEAGADVIFVESPESLEEIKMIAESVKCPILFNNVEGGRSPFLSKEMLQSLKISVAIYPNTLTRIIVKNALDVLRELKENGSTIAFKDKMLTHRELFYVFKHDDWVRLEAKYFN